MNESTDQINPPLSSHRQIGGHYLFQPNLNKVNARNQRTPDIFSAVECKVTGVTFNSKVHYQIEVKYQEQGKVYWVAMGSVPGDFICDLEPDDDPEFGQPSGEI